MNYHPIIDRMKTIAELLPNISGGGTSLDYPFVDYQEITVVSDLMGTFSDYQTEYLPSLTSDNLYPTILQLIDNTYSGQYSGKCAIRLSSLDSASTIREGVRLEGATNVSVAFYIGSNSIIHQYTFGGGQT